MLVRHGDIYPCYVLLVIFNPLFHGILPLFLPMLAIRIFSLVSSDNTLPNSFARRLALASDVCGGNFNPLFHGGFCFGLPSNELLILAECSGDCLRPNIDCRIFSKVSGLCLYYEVYQFRGLYDRAILLTVVLWHRLQYQLN